MAPPSSNPLSPPPLQCSKQKSSFTFGRTYYKLCTLFYTSICVLFHSVLLLICYWTFSFFHYFPTHRDHLSSQILSQGQGKFRSHNSILQLLLYITPVDYLDLKVLFHSIAKANHLNIQISTSIKLQNARHGENLRNSQVHLLRF